MNNRRIITNAATPERRRRLPLVALVGVTALAPLTACGGSGGSASSSASSPAVTAVQTTSLAADEVVLPVSSNPITNSATAERLKIDSVLVENNVDPTTGAAADDHLEISVTNTGSSMLTGFELYYTITDLTSGESEAYYTALPATFSIDAGSNRTIHFDRSGAPDHFADNPYSLYHTSISGLDVTVEVSADGAAPQTVTVQKDPGGDEVAD